MRQSVLSFSLSEEALRKELEEKDQQVQSYAYHCRKLEESAAELRAIIDKKDENIVENRARLSEQMLYFARKERSAARKNLAKAQFEIGYVIMTPTVSDELGESWIWGQKYKDAVQQNKLYRQYLKKERRSNDPYVTAGAATTSSISAAIRREDMILREKLEELEREKTVLLKEIRRIADEDRSRFSSVELLANRYVMMSLLGRGGFSEVWKAYDIRNCANVAIKFHQVSSEWSEERKRNYIRHSKRECEVHMTLDHPKVIQLYDVEILDDNTFVSVMEYSEGCDLDTYLKRNGFLRETEAKTILLQLIQGLRYLAEREERIIHYDLKPANILFSSVLSNCWDIKITDFGLCKIMSKGNELSAMYNKEQEDTEIELTSQGTGTYWYLPPECFQAPMSSDSRSSSAMYKSKPDTPLEQKPARISAKVDVWALGVVFYQMLFGRRPFGEGLTQKQIWNNNVMGKIKGIAGKSSATDAEIENKVNYILFPSKPSVTVEAKEFIKSCFQVSTSERPDIFQLAKHPYVINQLQCLGSDGALKARKSQAGSSTKSDQKELGSPKAERKTEQNNSNERSSQESATSGKSPRKDNRKRDTVLSNEEYPLKNTIDTGEKIDETIEKEKLLPQPTPEDSFPQTGRTNFTSANSKKRPKRIDPVCRVSTIERDTHGKGKLKDTQGSSEPNISLDEYEQLLKSL
ncbi:protein kinase [Perkinsela sp. CCAP 1560/4]|nr:protein kinase [Perkinsela sp. CCAP 1560/4]|eukprot:KNH09455.1 protein kinase [Perkinsela sp. CCAP 1560/4]